MSFAAIEEGKGPVTVRLLQHLSAGAMSQWTTYPGG